MWENSKFAYSYPPDNKDEWWHIFYITPTQKERQSTEQLSKHIVMLMEKSIGESLTNIFHVIAETEQYIVAHKSGNTMKCRNYLSIGAQKVINASDFHLPIVADMLSHWYNSKYLESSLRAESHAAVALTEAMDKYLSLNPPGQTSDNKKQIDIEEQIRESEKAKPDDNQ